MAEEIKPSTAQKRYWLSKSRRHPPAPSFNYFVVVFVRFQSERQHIPNGSDDIAARVWRSPQSICVQRHELENGGIPIEVGFGVVRFFSSCKEKRNIRSRNDPKTKVGRSLELLTSLKLIASSTIIVK